MIQVLAAILIIVLIKLLIDNLKPTFTTKKQPPSQGDFIDISEKWISTDELPYKKNDYLFNKREEMMFFEILRDIIDKTGYSLFPHVHMANLLTVPTDTQNRQEYLLRIKERSLDMVIFDSAYLTPKLVINMKAGETKRQQIYRQFTKKALLAAGIKSIDIDVNNLPSREDLVKILQNSGLDL